MSIEDRDWQRLDTWLWCARFAKHRAECGRLAEAGQVRVNRQPTDKPHARLRVGDTLTLAIGREVRVIVVEALAARRGPATEARALYREIAEDRATAQPAGLAAAPGGGCERPRSAAYPASVQPASAPAVVPVAASGRAVSRSV